MSSTNWFDLPNAPAKGKWLCALDNIPDGTAKLLWIASESVTETASKGSFGLILLRSGTTVRAYVNRCPHFGVPLATKPEQLIFVPQVSLSCNVHYAKYSWHDGLCRDGECSGESLLPVPVGISIDGRVVVE
ncbi:MAG: hypothetical protein H6R13_57 [Proteobacteria bacterium]|nr:hypothetical protein [Pseudomonadota bacterium]